MPVCLICNEFRGKGPLPTDEEYRESNPIMTRHVKRNDIAWGSFVQSAETCYCCEVLRKGVVGCLSQHGLKAENVKSIDLEFFYQAREGTDEDSNKNIICKMMDDAGADSGQDFQVEFFTLDEPDCPCPDAWEYVPVAARTTVSTQSEEAFEKAQAWIRDCDDEYHGKTEENEDEDENWDGDPEYRISYCAAARREDPSPLKLPTRLVDVGLQSGKVRVVETANLQADKYICLSHCWGLQQIITTKVATLADRMQEVSIDDLSQTFWDAICMTRRFGIGYIWIDSLCIIQDDAPDWQRESAQMASIYRNTYLTIAATKASSGAGGLFADTPDFEVRGTTPAGEDYFLVFREKMEHELSVDLTTDLHFPLMARGWIYQERMLSPRVLHFGYHELFFECATNCQCECGDIGFVGNFEDIPLPNPRQMYSSALESIAKAGKSKGAVEGKWSNELWLKQGRYYIARIWRSMVMFYTGLRLTVPGDRLPAVGGVARTFAGKRKSTYLAGLFDDAILDDLLWDVSAGKKGRPTPGKYIAPSWSWASVAEPINYRDGLVYYDEDIYQETQEGRVEFARVESCEATRAGLDEFGQVASGRLRITGPLLPATVLLLPGLGKGGRRMYQLQLGGGGDDHAVASPRVWPDYDWSEEGRHYVSPDSSVQCMRMVRYLEDDTDMFLVLRHHEDSEEDAKGGTCYERIGSLRLLAGAYQPDGLELEEWGRLIDMFDQAPERSVDIV